MTSQGSLMLFWEGTIKGEYTRTLGLSSGSSDTECLGLVISHRPSTPAISVSLMEQSITRMNWFFSFIHMHVPRPFWGTFSQCDFSCLTLAGYVTTCIPLNPVLSEAQRTTLWQWIARVE